MANIPISQIVTVNPAVVSAGGPQTSLDGLFLTQSTAVAPGQLQPFYSAAAVTGFFGAGSDESTAAQVYFAGVLNGGQLPATLTFARYAQAATSAQVIGAPTGLTLAQLQALSGTLIVTTDTQRTSSAINLAAATSFADAAARMTAGFTTPNFAITYDNARDRFILSTTATGTAATTSAITGTLASAVGLSAAAGAFLQATGLPADTAGTAMDRATVLSTNWAIFSTIWAATLAERTALAAWNSANGQNQFIYVGWDTEAASIVANNASSFGGVVFNTPYTGTVPLYGGLVHAAGVMAWAGATTYDVVDGRNALAFRQLGAGATPSVTNLATANALLTNGYTYYGSYANSANNYSIYYNGALSGAFDWSDTYLGQIWLRRTLQQALFETLLAYNSLPYNADGYNAIYQGAQATILQATAAGIIREGVTLSPSQRAQVNQQARLQIDDQLSTVGWYLQVSDPLNASVRTERGSPIVKFWYCDGGSIQKIDISSTTVL
ncbi:hypothetical protein [Xanthomonas phage NEB7]|nr:hypothetical protein [Xanthomonas phage NEB7]